ncbi:protein TALPID3 isoform X5 [Cottoperca gobio]|uniref:Protein TALPID3 isoform X5 n=1 Tax=Cottoperca gobio TaxID=56716 RepID=A0A6J2PE00_COTGO|nr:protein TALPID3-like isoform X5 [Cottoperca gobio]
MSVDSALIRQLVSEVLSEQVALMLGQKDSQEPEPVPGSQARHEDSLVQTPAPTPPCSPAPPSRETRPLDTPPLSEPTSLLNHKSPQPITAPEPVTTPPCSSEPTPSAASPPAVHQAPPLLTWGDAELPLDEERLEEHLPLLISVAEEEPPLSTLSPPSLPPAPSPSPPPPEPNPGAASPPSSSSEDSSSSTVTAETEAALRHISEGELLLSVQQEAICSFSSSLQELQEMDFDPPSEGQVRGHDLLLSLLTKMEQGVTHTLRGERPQLEGSWGGGQEEEVSIGEVRDNRTTNPRSYSTSTAAREVQTTSPGQISQCADVSEVSLEATNQDSVVVGDLMIGTLISDLQSDLSLTPPPHPAAEQQQGGARRMEVHLLSITPEEEEEEEEEEDQEEVSAAADTDSSTDDVF